MACTTQCTPACHATPHAVQALCGALFPRYARLVLQRLLEVVQASWLCGLGWEDVQGVHRPNMPSAALPTQRTQPSTCACSFAHVAVSALRCSHVCVATASPIVSAACERCRSQLQQPRCPHCTPPVAAARGGALPAGGHHYDADHLPGAAMLSDCRLGCRVEHS